MDRTDTVRARVAAGLLERIAEWNGYGRALYPYACGVEALQVCLPLPSLPRQLLLQILWDPWHLHLGEVAALTSRPSEALPLWQGFCVRMCMMLVTMDSRSMMGCALYHCLLVQELDWSTSAALMGMAGMLGIRAKLFAAQPEQLVYEDFDRWRVTSSESLRIWMPKQAIDNPGFTLHGYYLAVLCMSITFQYSLVMLGRRACCHMQGLCRCDLLVAMDDELLEQALSIAGSEKDQAWYAPRCTTLTAFAPYCGTALLNPGGNGVLEPELRQIVAPVITRAQAAHGIARPDLRTGRHTDLKGVCK